MGTLKDLLLQHSFSFERAGAVVGVDPQLLLRVDQRRQPLRMDVVRRLAGVLGESTGTVEVAAGRVVESTDDRFLNPHPPIPILGDSF